MSSSQQWKERLGRPMRELVRQAERQGWDVGVTSNSHVRFTAPNGAVVIAQGVKQPLAAHLARTKSRLLRAGLEIAA
jgi:peptidoglycan/xylan/chitin deacetylase (PgdA/CDA1 family)